MNQVHNDLWSSIFLKISSKFKFIFYTAKCIRRKKFKSKVHYVHVTAHCWFLIYKCL